MEPRGFEAVRLIPMRSKVTLKAQEVNEVIPDHTFEKTDHLHKPSKAPGHQIVWFGDQKFTYPY